MESSLPNIQHRHQSRPFLDSQRGLLISIFQSRNSTHDALVNSSCSIAALDVDVTEDEDEDVNPASDENVNDSDTLMASEDEGVNMILGRGAFCPFSILRLSFSSDYFYKNTGKTFKTEASTDKVTATPKGKEGTKEYSQFPKLSLKLLSPMTNPDGLSHGRRFVTWCTHPAPRHSEGSGRIQSDADGAQRVLGTGTFSTSFDYLVQKA